jgi:hypothetical protein
MASDVARALTAAGLPATSVGGQLNIGPVTMTIRCNTSSVYIDGNWITRNVGTAVATRVLERVVTQLPRRLRYAQQSAEHASDMAVISKCSDLVRPADKCSLPVRGSAAEVRASLAVLAVLRAVEPGSDPAGMAHTLLKRPEDADLALVLCDMLLDLGHDDTADAVRRAYS